MNTYYKTQINFFYGYYLPTKYFPMIMHKFSKSNFQNISRKLLKNL